MPVIKLMQIDKYSSGWFCWAASVLESYELIVGDVTQSDEIMFCKYSYAPTSDGRGAFRMRLVHQHIIVLSRL